MKQAGGIYLSRRGFAALAFVSAKLASLQASVQRSQTKSVTSTAHSEQQQFPVPDLANLYPFLDQLAEYHTPRLSYLRPEWKDVEAWKAKARPIFLRQLSYDPDRKFKAEVLAKETRDGLLIETVRLRCRFYDIPAKVLKPANAKKPLPGILALHDHSGRYVWGMEKLISSPDDHPALVKFRNSRYGRPMAEALAKRGYVVMVIDAFYFGSRRLRPEEMDIRTAPPYFRSRLKRLAETKPGTEDWLNAINSVCAEAEHLTAKTIFSTGATWPGILVWDDQRALDYLASRDDVDEKRLGALGLSLGGIRTAYLIAADARIKVACVVGWMTEFRHQLRNHLRSHTWMVYVPGLYQWLDLPDAAALTMPGALLVLQCRRDRLYPLSGMKASLNTLTRIYEKAELAERFRGNFYDVPHSFTPPMQEEAFAWIDRWI